jgi:prolyl-tRNA synthetase
MYTRYAQYFPQTRREISQGETVSPGYAFLDRGGFIRSAGAAGIYNLLPLGWRVHRKVCDVIFDEMERQGVLNMTLPILQPKELWEKTGRWDAYVASKTLFRTHDEHRGAEFGLAPTAEEMVTALVAGDVKSWRELPLHLHQIGPKFRDEIRPRLGLLRGREFSMSDAYSFDRDEAGMRDSFELYRKIYTRIFERVGLDDVVAVQADSGAIGGQGSAEFMVLNDAGEDTLLTCGQCEYGANAEKAEGRYVLAATDPELRPAERVGTPGVKTVEQLETQFPDIAASQMIKTLLFVVDSGAEESHLIAVCIRGDLAVNEVKLANQVGGAISPAEEDEIFEATGAPVGFAGPIDLRGVQSLYFDRSAEGMTNFLCGVNENDVHILNANFGRDVESPSQFVDVHLAKDGDGCPICEGTLSESRGIELGHVFMLQRGYAKALNATFTDKNGLEETMWMGCYGIGTTRLVQAIAEQCHDGDGLVWPKSVAPFDLHVVMTKPEDPAQISVLSSVAELLDRLELTALVDDRDASPGVKFKDADLLGCPVRLTIGRDAEDGKVEVRNRASGETLTVSTADLSQALAGESDGMAAVTIAG